MIYHLLHHMVTLLRAELPELVTPSDAAIGLGLPSPSAALPTLWAAPGSWGLTQTRCDVGSSTALVREFQNDFAIYLAAQNLLTAEHYTSLIVGILLASHDALVQQFNVPDAARETPTYRSQRFATTHTLNSFKFLNAAYVPGGGQAQTSGSSGSASARTGQPSAPDRVTMQLNWQAVGNLKTTLLTPEGDRLIERVTISVTKSPAP